MKEKSLTAAPYDLLPASAVCQVYATSTHEYEVGGHEKGAHTGIVCM